MPRYAGIVLGPNGLQLGRRVLPGDHPALLLPDEVVVRQRRFAWDDGRTVEGWSVSFEPPSRYYWGGLYLFPGTGRPLRLGSWIVRQDAHGAAQALADYLCHTPEARAGLADHRRCAALLADLHADRRPGHQDPPLEPLGGRSYDIHWAIRRVVEAHVPRLFLGRPVAGEPLPAPADLLPDVRVRLARATPRRDAGDAELLERIARHLDLAPWPFAALTAPS